MKYAVHLACVGIGALLSAALIALFSDWQPFSDSAEPQLKQRGWTYWGDVIEDVKWDRLTSTGSWAESELYQLFKFRADTGWEYAGVACPNGWSGLFVIWKQPTYW